MMMLLKIALKVLANWDMCNLKYVLAIKGSLSFVLDMNFLREYVLAACLSTL